MPEITYILELTKAEAESILAAFGLQRHIHGDNEAMKKLCARIVDLITDGPPFVWSQEYMQ